jgi:CRISPR/Cas system CSM-associated protein Csm2 small subunit
MYPIKPGNGGGTGSTEPVTANNVTETSSRVFVSPSEKAQITTNKNDISSLKANVSEAKRIIVDCSTGKTKEEIFEFTPYVPTVEELMEKIRQERNIELFACDWTVFA